MKISTLLAIGLISMGTFAFGKFTFSAFSAAQNYEKVGTLRALADMRNEWIKGIIALSLERSVSQVMLSMDSPAPAQFSELNAAQREQSNVHFSELDAALAQSDFPNKEVALENASHAKIGITKLRSTIDALLSQPQAVRDRAASDAVIAALKSTISRLESQTDVLTVENALSSTSASVLNKVQKLAWEIREFGGRARTLYAIAALHQTPLSSAERATAMSYLQRANDSWIALRQIEVTTELPETVTNQIEAIRTDYIGAYITMIGRMNDQMDQIALAANAENATAAPAEVQPLDGVPFDVYFETSGRALDQAAKLADLASQELNLYWEERAQLQLRVLLFDIAGLIIMAAAMALTLRAVNRKITQRLRQGLEELSNLTNGQLEKDISKSSQDLAEMAQFAEGLHNLQIQLRSAAVARQNLAASESAQKAVVDRLTEGLTKLAAGDLTQRIDDQFDSKYQSLADNFNAATASLGELVARVIDTSGSILAGARGINTATTDLSQRTETQGMTLQNAAAALEQLTRNIISSQGDTTDLDALAAQANEKSVEMRGKMGQTVEAIEKIKSSSQQIEQIVGVIEDIAFQTNLLALNAGVEATRAGAEGSGFAVIASEVRGLAERSAQSAQDIKNLIAASGVEVAKGVEYVAEAEASVTDIGEQFAQISSLISRIATAASEQSLGLTKVNDGVSQLDLVTQTNVAMVEETTAECVSLTSVAQELTQLVARFQINRGQAVSADPLSAKTFDQALVA